MNALPKNLELDNMLTILKTMDKAVFISLVKTDLDGVTAEQVALTDEIIELRDRIEKVIDAM